MFTGHRLIELGETDDTALLKQYLAGDDSALAALCDRYSQPLKRVINSYLDPHVARRVSRSDLVQETWMAAVGKLKNNSAIPEIALFPWLREIARERVIDAHRMHRGAAKRNVYREQHLVATDASVSQLVRLVPGDQASPSQIAISKEDTQKVRQALDALPAKDREIIVLRFIERHEMRRCADILGLTVEAAKSRQRRALVSFAELFGHTA